jgi:hypothetical protein
VNWKNTVQASKPLSPRLGVSYHLQNVALLQCTTRRCADVAQHAYSFPDVGALSEPARPAPAGRRGGGAFGAATTAAADTVKPVAVTGGPNGHKLIGYWSGYGPIRDVSPQWDVILVAFATPDHAAGEGQMRYRVNGSMTPEEFKADIKLKQSQGKKVMISLGGGGQVFALETDADRQRFVTSVGRSALIRLRRHQYRFRDALMKCGLATSTETSDDALDDQPDYCDAHDPRSFRPAVHGEPGSWDRATPAGYPGYGGSSDRICRSSKVRDILSFVDAQDYNPPIQDWTAVHARLRGLPPRLPSLLRGFDVGRRNILRRCRREGHHRLLEQRHDAADRR